MSQNFRPIWISTIEHLDEHARITASTSFLSKVFGRFNCPKSFPQIQPLFGLFFYMKIPLVHFQSGELSVSKGSLDFQGEPPKVFSYRVSGDFPKVNFHLNPEQIKSVVKYSYPHPYMKWANLEWIRVRTTEAQLGGDFLMCVGGIAPGMIKQQTDNLMSAIQSML
ncbi:MAG: hypothetical protein P1V35_04670 [Planctomycetota bacterium]|nr:hypothetical protein [Planctomycetota bacterium]